MQGKITIIYTASLLTTDRVIPAKAGIQESTGFPRIKYGAGLVKPGMTKCIRIMSSCIAAIFWLLLYNLAPAQDGWQIDIKAGILDAENRLSIGQKSDAADGPDARYDVPAFLSGDIMAYIEEPEGKRYWRKFRSYCEEYPCTKKWDISIESYWRGEIIKLSWNFSSLPSEMKIRLVDTATGDVIDMQMQNEYSYKNIGKRKFQVVVQL